jgi:hypothetical protein
MYVISFIFHIRNTNSIRISTKKQRRDTPLLLIRKDYTVDLIKEIEFTFFKK